MSHMEFTPAQLTALEKMLAETQARPPQLSIRLDLISDDALREVSDTMWRLPVRTTRQFVTREAIIKKVTEERDRRQAKQEKARAAGGTL